MKLLIAIPALNEEESIASIIERSLAARDHIIANSPVDEVAITVVSDGSTDRTVELAKRYTDRIHLIVFERNRGYGAAIKEAWSRSDADVLGFLDADGTCDPKFFAPLCATLENEHADVAIGCRLNKGSRMPLLRRVGNTLFATLLTIVSSSRVRDTASGMRVVRKSSLGRLLPLPNGLSFTPAMSARAMLSDTLRIVELDMPYDERAGESKLHVVKDGLRFLRVILETAFLYRPARLLGLAALALFLGASGLMLKPALYYLEHHSVQEWMIYRFLVGQLLGLAACLCFSAACLTDHIVSMALSSEIPSRRDRWPLRTLHSRWFWAAVALLVLAGGGLVLSSFLQLLSTGHTYEHWSRYVAMTFLLSTALILVITRGVGFIIDLVAGRLTYLEAREERNAGE